MHSAVRTGLVFELDISSMGVQADFLNVALKLQCTCKHSGGCKIRTVWGRGSLVYPSLVINQNYLPSIRAGGYHHPPQTALPDLRRCAASQKNASPSALLAGRFFVSILRCAGSAPGRGAHEQLQ